MEDYETYTISQIRATWKRHFSTEQRDARTRLIGSKEAIFLKEVKKITMLTLPVPISDKEKKLS